MIRAMLVAVLSLGLLAGVAQAQPAPADNAQPSRPQEQLDREFAETMSGATLVGNFTVTGMDTDKPLKTDRYTLGKVSKLNNDFWSFETRIQYGDHDVKLPLALQVKWAGDTPLITLTDVGIPGLGTFTARVLVYRGQYAGTWQHGEHGGQMFGKIIRADAADKADVKGVDAKGTDAK
jgi:hypothetical protein